MLYISQGTYTGTLETLIVQCETIFEYSNQSLMQNIAKDLANVFQAVVYIPAQQRSYSKFPSDRL